MDGRFGMPEVDDQFSDARKMLRKARMDLIVARIRIRGVLPELHCFHAQQAAEKGLKAASIARGVPYKFVHDLPVLADGLKVGGVQIPEDIVETDRLSRVSAYAAGTRYEMTGAGPSEADRKEAVELADAVLKWARAEITRAKKESKGK